MIGSYGIYDSPVGYIWSEYDSAGPIWQGLDTGWHTGLIIRHGGVHDFYLDGAYKAIWVYAAVLLRRKASLTSGDRDAFLPFQSPGGAMIGWRALAVWSPQAGVTSTPTNRRKRRVASSGSRRQLRGRRRFAASLSSMSLGATSLNKTHDSYSPPLRLINTAYPNTDGSTHQF